MSERWINSYKTIAMLIGHELARAGEWFGGGEADEAGPDEWCAVASRLRAVGDLVDDLAGPDGVAGPAVPALEEQPRRGRRRLLAVPDRGRAGRARAGPGGRKQRGMILLSRDDLRRQPGVAWLVEGWIQDRAVGLLSGAPESYKS